MSLMYDSDQVGLYTNRAIKKGEELFYNYRFEDYSPSEENAPTGDVGTVTGQRCYCGSQSCVGWIGKRKKEKVDDGKSKKKRVSEGGMGGSGKKQK